MKGITMPEITYRQWRGELTQIQQKIDAFDEAFYDKICDNPIPTDILEEQKLTDEYNVERKKLTGELEAHYAKEPMH